MPSIDLRGFRDALEPVRRQREWELDRAIARLAAARAAHLRSQESERAAQWETESQSQIAAQAWTRHGDPTARGRLLEFLVQLQQRQIDIARQTAKLAGELAVAQAALLQRQQELEALQRHRADALAEYRLEQDRRAAAQADDAWLARSTQNQEGVGP